MIGKDLNTIDYKDINRGCIYSAAIPFSEERPLKIVSTSNNSKVTGKILDEDKDTFNGSIGNDGKRHSDIIDIVIRHKRRLVAIIQDDKFNHDKSYNFVYVIPLTTFEKNDKKIKFFKEHRNVPNYHYIGLIGNYESVANISDIKRIHKSLLLKKENYKAINSEIIKDICIKVSVFLEINKIQKCEKCIYNYENYIKNSVINKNEKKI